MSGPDLAGPGFQALGPQVQGGSSDLTSWQELQLIIQDIGSASDEMPTRVSQANGREAGRQEVSGN